ncbi:MAG: hypothetical protein R3E35_04145 [Rhodocyclaceae bacterium]|jgi:hypothetical protein
MSNEACSELAGRLNRDCQCISLDREALRRALDGGESGADLNALVDVGRSNLFSDSAVFVGAECLRRMAGVIAAVESVVALPAWREQVLAWAPATARHAPKCHGVFLGYDFHLSAAGPQLIEINTNAGGGLLNAALAQAQRACCEEVSAVLPGEHAAATVEQDFADMFVAEWRAERGDAPLGRIAIVDVQPEAQFLYPEFVLFRKLFERHGIAAAICDPADLAFRDGALWLDGGRVDLVYNRLTDFGLVQPASAALREAWLAGAAVVTPHPRAHALYADKRNLALLSDEAALAGLGVDAATRAILLAGIPRTRPVRREEAEALWAGRKQLFFKPAAGFGSKAAYRGDKLTRRVFEEVLEGSYIAQTLVPPSGRRIGAGEAQAELKVDLRNFVYRGRVQLVSARLYQGQTTNFRTPGGGFAPVLTVPGMEQNRS